MTEAKLYKVKNLVNDRVRKNEASPSTKAWGFLFSKRNRLRRKASILTSFIPEYRDSGNSEERIKDPQHGWIHLQRVANFAQKIVKTLKVDNKIDINVLLAACYLHDINHTFYPPGLLNYFLERRRLKKVLPKVLAELDIDVYEKAIIENAIYLSPFSFPFKMLNKNGDLYTKILQDADTLDFFSRQREVSFNRAKKNIVFYAFLGLFSRGALAYGRKNIANYLNFPQTAKEDYVQKS